MANDSNFAELAALPKPIRIDYWVKDTKLAHFRTCAKNIASLSFRGSFSNLSDISEMKTFTRLEGTDLGDTQIPDLEPLRDLPLTWLRVGRTPIASLEPLRGKTSLTLLDIDCFTGDLAPVATLVNLTNLSAMATNITDLSLLAPLTQLAHLSLQTTAITDLKPLIGKPLTHLTISHLRTDKAVSLKPLEQLPHLRSLYLYGTKVDEAEVASLQKALPNLYISR
jgi:Leucine-rich repeat (LRR) protein